MRIAWLLILIVSANLEAQPGELGCPAAIETEFMELLNNYRVANLLNPVEFDGRLVTAAQSYANRMASEDFFSHVAPDGEDFVDRILEVGYPLGGTSELIGASYDDATTMFDTFVNSPLHLDLLTNPSLTHIGVGFATEANSEWTNYWALYLGSSLTTEPTNCSFPFRVGDPNSDGSVNLADSIHTLNFLFSDGPEGCLAAMDVNQDVSVNVADAVYLLNFLFVSGPDPQGPQCGPHPAGLRCAEYDQCP